MSHKIRNLIIVSLAILTVSSQFAGVAHAAIVEPGFESEVVASGFTLPSAMAFVPDGRIFVAEKGGAVRVIKNGALLPTPLITLSDVNTFGDRGLLSIVIDPSFMTNGYLYLSYTFENTPGSSFSGPKTGHIVRVTVVGDIASESSKLVLVGTVGGNAATPSCLDYPSGTDCIASEGISHSVGALRFGPDGKLYASLGDGSNFDVVDPRAMRAQDIDALAGKVLRINKDGTAPSDNPFYNGNPNANRSKVYALGFRNAFRMNFNPTTGALFIGDVGWSTWEEVNRVVSGGNYGWPCNEGASANAPYACTVPGAIAPVYTYHHDSSGAGAVVAGSFPANGAYPALYNSSWFFGDYAQNWIKRMVVDASGNMTSVNDFMDNADGPVDVTTGMDGNIYYLSIYTGELHRITHTTGNRRPVPVISANPTSGLTPLNVTFSSAGSADPDGDALTYSWNFGDGSALSALANPTHPYTTNGTYSAVLTLSDSHGASAAKILTISVGNQAPTAHITSPASGTLFAVGQMVNLQGSGTDPEDGALPASSFHWTVILHHNTHIHILQEFDGVANPSFAFPDHGSADIYVEVLLSVVDSGALVGTQSINAYLNTGGGAGNLVHNPSVEVESAIVATPVDWVKGNFGVNNPVFTYPVAGLVGDKAMQVTITGYVDGNAKYYFDPVFVTPEQQYSFSNMYTSTVETTRYAQFGFSNGTYQYAVMDTLPAAAVPTLASGLVTIPLGVQTLTIFHELSQNGTLVTDDFSLMLVNAADGTAPNVAITAPAPSAAVFGAVTVTATATDNVGVVGVTLVVDGTDVGVEDTVAPYEFTWNTTPAMNGGHVLTTRARDEAGNSKTSVGVNVNVDNALISGNLIINGSLEAADGLNPLGWIPQVWGTHTRTLTYPTVGHDGGKAATVEITAYPVGATGNSGWQHAEVAVTPGTQYTFGAWYKSTAASMVIGRYTMTDGSRQFFYVINPVAANPAWTFHTATFVAPAGAASVTVLDLISAVGTLSIDDVSLTTAAADPIQPDVAISSPVEAAAVSGTVTVGATATDNVAVAGVTLLVDGVVTGFEDTVAPYSFVWVTTTTTNGVHVLSARARDASGNWRISVGVNVNVNNGAAPSNLIVNGSLEAADGVNPLGWIPQVWGTHTRSLTYPTVGHNGGKAATVEITAYPVGATGNAGWQHAEVAVTPGNDYTFGAWFKSTADSIVLGRYTMTDGSRQFFYVFTPPVAANPAWTFHSGTFVAPAGAVSVTVLHLISSVGTLSIDDVSLAVTVAADTIMPDVAISSPAAATVVSGTTTVSATATDNVGVTGVMLLVDGVDVGVEATVAPYEFSWVTASVSNGAHVLTARAHDAAGNSKTSAPVTVNVNNTDATLPIVMISTPAEAETVTATVTVGATANDNVGVVGVRFFVDDALIGSEDTLYPYEFSWDTTTVTNSVHVLTARARDAAGNARTSEGVSITVNNPTAQPNLIVNGSFEAAAGANPVGWSQASWGNHTAVYTYPAVGRDGGKAAAVQITNYPFTDGTGDSRWIHDEVPVTPGTQYTYSNWFKSTVISDAIGRYTMADGSFHYFGVIKEIPATPDWTFHSGTFTAPVNAVSVTVLHLLSSAGTLTLDDVSLVVSGNGTPDEIEPPTVTWINPAPDGIVAGTITLQVDAIDNVGVTGLWFSVDGVPFGPVLNAAPWTMPWDSSDVSNGMHTLKATAHDAVGNNVAVIISITVDNSMPGTQILNPSLETPGVGGNPANWVKNAWGTNTPVFTYPVAGVNGGSAAKLDVTSYASGDAKWYFRDVSVTGGESYTFTHQYMATAPNGITYRFTKADGSVQYVGGGTFPAVAAWTPLTTTFVVPAGSVTMTVFRTLTAVGSLTIDDFNLSHGIAGTFAKGLVTYSFDDGWLSQYTEALPIMQAANQNATFYIISQYTQEAAPLGFELIQNASLETAGTGGNPAGWLRGGWGTNDRTYTYPVAGVSGASAAKVDITTHTSGDAKWYFANVAVTPGEKYIISDNYNSTVGTEAVMQYTLTGGGVQYGYLGIQPATGGSWQPFTREITIPADVVSATLFHVLTGIGSLTVDNYSLRHEEPQLYVDPSKVLEIQSAGFEIGAHTRTHPNLTQLTVPQQESEIAGSKSDLLGMGAIGVTSIAYPYGNYDPAVEVIAQNAGYVGGRSVDRGFNTKNNDKFALKIQQLNRTTTLAEIQGWVNQAVVDKTWLIFMLHQISGNLNEDLGITPAFLQQITEVVAAANVDVITMNQGLTLMVP